ncbi:MAG: phenylacetic acid degradation protein [Acidimicrobiales bacterium]|jgi:uncharacterized protein (TIGR00369 family)|nr:phenylacetic acid degradation protein [Acidimicrobiales bacterium]
MRDVPAVPAAFRGMRHSLMGYVVKEFGEGRGLLEWTPTDELSNPVGMVHGGFVATMVDDSCGIAVQSLLAAVRAFPTVNMNVDFLRGIRIGNSFAVESLVVRVGRRVTVADSLIRDDTGQLMARGTCTFAVDMTDTDVVGFSAV